MKRFMSLHMPYLSTDRLRAQAHNAHAQSSGSMQLAHPPTATVAPCGQALRIVHINASARQQGIRPDLTLAAAKAILPSLIACDDDPPADRSLLESLAVWADRFSPTVHIEDADTLLIDITGCQRLYRDEQALLDRAMAVDRPITIHGAIADTAGAAWALSHASGNRATIAQPGQTAADLAPLPVWSLRVDHQTVETLASIGVETIAALWRLPRASLVARFDGSLLERMDQALGDKPEPLTPYRRQPVLACPFPLGRATTRIEVLKQGVRHALERFCQRLARRMGGVRQAFVTFYCPDIPCHNGYETRTVTLHVDLSQPTRSTDHLFSLLAVSLENLELPGPADKVIAWAREVDSLDDQQQDLFETRTTDNRTLGDLFDRLAVRLGTKSVVAPQLVSEHRPECAFHYVPLVGADHPQPHTPRLTDTLPPGPRPLRLATRPMEIPVTSLLPDGPPLSFRLEGVLHTVVQQAGPERIETGWWKGPHQQRDYFRTVTDTGLRSWLFRDRATNRWFLHGWFD